MTLWLIPASYWACLQNVLGSCPHSLCALEQAPAVDAENLVKKPPGEVVRYDRDFLLRFSQVHEKRVADAAHACAPEQPQLDDALP